MPRKALLIACVLCGSAASSTVAQYGSAALVRPGTPVPAQLLSRQGGVVGAEVAKLVGLRPVLLVYWRPGHGLSEAALLGAAELARNEASEVAFLPVAVTAASQSLNVVQERLQALGIRDQSPRHDGGRLGRLFGVRGVPSFVLIDAGGILRLVGGADIGQISEGGTSIADAVRRASRGQPVKTLGSLPSEPVYQLLGADLPDVEVDELGRDGRRRLAEYIPQGGRLLVFYWSPTCPHCKTALPKLRDWFVQTKPKDIAVVDIARADSPYLARDVPGVVGDYPWPHLLDTDSNVRRGLVARSTPTSYLISSDGKISSIKVGAGVDWGAWLAAP